MSDLDPSPLSALASALRSTRAQEPLEPSDLEADVDEMQQNVEHGETAAIAAWLAAEAIEAPGPAYGLPSAPRANLPDVASGPLLAAIEAAAASASPVAPGSGPELLERTATPDGLPQAARAMSPAGNERCAVVGRLSAYGRDAQLIARGNDANGFSTSLMFERYQCAVTVDHLMHHSISLVAWDWLES